PSPWSVNRYVGRIGEVTEEVSSSEGRVRIGNEVWSARTYGPVTIPPETPVVIQQIEGAIVWVANAGESAQTCAVMRCLDSSYICNVCHNKAIYSQENPSKFFLLFSSLCWPYLWSLYWRSPLVLFLMRTAVLFSDLNNINERRWLG